MVLGEKKSRGGEEREKGYGRAAEEGQKERRAGGKGRRGCARCSSSGRAPPKRKISLRKERLTVPITVSGNAPPGKEEGGAFSIAVRGGS